MDFVTQRDIVGCMEQSVSKNPDYWRYAASVDNCNVVIRRHEEEIARHKKLLRDWKKRRDNAIRLAEEQARV